MSMCENVSNIKARDLRFEIFIVRKISPNGSPKLESIGIESIIID